MTGIIRDRIVASKILSNLRFGVERVAGEIRSRGGEKTK